MKESKDIKSQIVKHVSQVSQTREALCKKFGITDRTLANWRKRDPEFDAAFTMAEASLKEFSKDEFRKLLNTLEGPALKSLRKLVTGYKFKQEQKDFVTKTFENADGTVTEEEIMISRRTKEINVEPNVQAIVFVLTNIDPEYFRK